MYNVFIVDDEPPLVRVLSRKVENYGSGFSVCGFAYNGIEAAQKLENLDADVLLSDIRMPVMDGLALISLVKRSHPDILSVVVSAYQDFEYAQSAIQLGAVDYLLKPIDSEQFGRTFKRLEELLFRDSAEIDEKTETCLTKIDFLLLQNDRNELLNVLAKLRRFLTETKHTEKYMTDVSRRIRDILSSRLGVESAVLSESAGGKDNFAFFTEIIDEHMGCDGPSSPKVTMVLMSRIDEYIHKNLEHAMSLSDICGDMHVSQPYISRVVRMYRRMSFTEYVTHLRIRKAQEIMRAVPDARIKDVANATGYEDQHYFSKVFKAIAGITPSEFKDDLKSS
ncbi:MAG: response regulator [Synergistaceae bacterium]|nr:response regulator [Synergistaceae bacterium]